MNVKFMWNVGLFTSKPNANEVNKLLVFHIRIVFEKSNVRHRFLVVGKAMFDPLDHTQ